MSFNDLKRKIIQIVGRKGAITFERFMEMALYDAEFGYYTSGAMRIGREGDFYTSSYLHPAFGAMIGRQIEEFWEFMGKPSEFEVFEMGAGAGYLCKDIIDSLKEREVSASLKFCIIEPVSAIREEQNGVLRDYGGRVKWFSSLGEISGIRGCLLSNELLDAFPVHLIEMKDGLKEVYVSIEEDRLRESPGPISDRAIADYLEEFSVRLAEGYRTEVNLRIKNWLEGVAAALDEGFVLTIDYGYTAREYYSEDRNRGTLMCYYRHQAIEDPLVNIGEEDITAHVNFSAVKKWGNEAGFETIGFCGQGAYLTSLGIDEEIKKLSSESKDYLFELARIKKLILPQGMGESHQVMIQYKGKGAPKLRGFTLRNRMKYL
ncbi:MAG TPA: SAM-dependent methyltransferase [Candidatus Sulfobium mesophilum]|nr:SAM-dependent methyltransferase [Candidatus Sulfobium mesophilum]